MMATKYLRRNPVKGRVYHYFRPSRTMAARGVKQVRLSDNETVAMEEASALLANWDAKKNRAKAPRPHTWRTKMLELARAAAERARRKKRAFEITGAALLRMLEVQDYRCAVTGLPFEIRYDTRQYWRHPFAPSLDRVRVAEGYTLANCRLVVACVNVAMGEWGEEVFYQIAEAALARRREREQNEILENT